MALILPVLSFAVSKTDFDSFFESFLDVSSSLFVFSRIPSSSCGFLQVSFGVLELYRVPLYVFEFLRVSSGLFDFL